MDTITLHISKESFEKYLGHSVGLAVKNFGVDYLKSLTSSGIDIKKYVDERYGVLELWRYLQDRKNISTKSRSMIIYLLEEVFADVTKVFHFIYFERFFCEIYEEDHIYIFFFKMLVKYGAELRFSAESGVLQLYAFVGTNYYDLLNYLVFTGISSEQVIRFQRHVDNLSLHWIYRDEIRNYLKPSNTTILMASIDGIVEAYVKTFIRFCNLCGVEETFSLEIILGAF